ncbi:hypothetical protein O1611_g4292 [Lasiodiplodia mahajangana]|uniref:Uncharacterized protein n=1 Tax=Lasiodiplodia mahajangana TaxID=1108764 RepID=A0ACC2JPF2_9PEZI|nr:hypothetical protein O1611_g4292 [Lasiodiplodia mahajangana]
MEPAVRHSVVAVGSLYEQVHRLQDTTLLPDDSLVLSHYNSAICHLKNVKNESLVLLVCILFVCIEFLRGNRAAAAKHCQHGISILKRVEETFPWAREYLSPLFRRLSVLPFFFSAGDCSPDPLLCLDDAIPPFSTLSEAQFYLDGILSRTVSLIRRGDTYRLGCMRHKPVSPDLIAEQKFARTLLGQWHSSFVQLVAKSPEPGSTHTHRSNMLMRYLVCHVWVETAFEFHQTGYDRYLDVFRSMVDAAAAVEAAGFCMTAVRFTFEMGFVPLLYFIALKCRCLDTRLRALSLMRRLGAAKENLWEMTTMFASAKRLVEIEHGAALSDDGKLCGEPSCPGLPPDEVRVRDTTTEPMPIVQVVDGVEKTGRLGGFFMRTADDGIDVRSEFLPEPSWA